MIHVSHNQGLSNTRQGRIRATAVVVILLVLAACGNSQAGRQRNSSLVSSTVTVNSASSSTAFFVTFNGKQCALIITPGLVTPCQKFNQGWVSYWNDTKKIDNGYSLAGGGPYVSLGINNPPTGTTRIQVSFLFSVGIYGYPSSILYIPVASIPATTMPPTTTIHLPNASTTTSSTILPNVKCTMRLVKNSSGIFISLCKVFKNVSYQYFANSNSVTGQYQLSSTQVDGTSTVHLIDAPINADTIRFNVLYTDFTSAGPITMSMWPGTTVDVMLQAPREAYCYFYMDGTTMVPCKDWTNARIQLWSPAGQVGTDIVPPHLNQTRIVEMQKYLTPDVTSYKVWFTFTDGKHVTAGNMPITSKLETPFLQDEYLKFP